MHKMNLRKKHKEKKEKKERKKKEAEGVFSRAQR